jgi:GntR family transcriptional regulator/MocR family aminotransferase
MWGICLDRESELSLRRQIYRELRDQILNGTLQAGETLPSTRELSAGLNVSRSTVCEAYEMLIAEGFTTSSQGAPTRVAEGISIEKASTPIGKIQLSAEPFYPIDFRTGRPDLRLFPRFLWQQMINKALEGMPATQYDYTGAQGSPELRAEIAAWLYRSRGLTVEASDIFITQGATHALHLVAELLAGRGRDILIEDPCHTGMLRTLKSKGCRLIPVPADHSGIQTSQLSDFKFGAVYVTPSHQFPLGGILSASRRADLIRSARENDAYIIEDDYDSEFRFCGEPVAPLLAMEPQRVIYVGTFSKSVYPALRIGYAILPAVLQKQWLQLRTFHDVQNPILEQAAMAMFLRTRKMDRHVQKMRRIYGERRKVLLESFRRTFGQSWQVYGDNSGLHLTVDFPELTFGDDFRKNALDHGINISTVEYHSIVKGLHKTKLLIGYGHLEPEEIRHGVEVLGNYIRDYFHT